MTAFHEIKNMDDAWYDEFSAIYSTSFPIFEQRNEEQQLSAFEDEHYHLICLIENGKFYSFISYWDFDSFVYIEHLAVNNELRGQHIGTKTLNLFKNEIGKLIILEIDPVQDEVSAKRLNFYEKIGFQMNPYNHFHPAYNTSFPPHELLVLSTEKILNEYEYSLFNEKLQQVVMK